MSATLLQRRRWHTVPEDICTCSSYQIGIFHLFHVISFQVLRGSIEPPTRLDEELL